MDTLCNKLQPLSLRDPVNQAEEHVDRSEEMSNTSTRHTISQFQGAYGFNIHDSHFDSNKVKNVYYSSNHDKPYEIPSLYKYTSLDAIHDSSAQDPTRQVHPGTRELVLKHIHEWIDTLNAKERIVWLHGPAGIGKSTIAQTIAHTYAREKLLATFFFYRSDPNRNNGNRLFTTLAWQFAMSNPAIRKAIIDSLKERPDIPTKDVEKQFEELIVKPFLTSNVQQLAPVVIIDGVDECSDERLQRRFLRIIGNAVKDNRIPVRFLICSRPEAHIQDTINIFESITLSLDLAELDDANQDIEKYLKDEFDRIATRKGLNPAWPGEQIIEDLVYKASGQFIYASTVIKRVDEDQRNAKRQLRIILELKPHSNVSLFAELDELYKEILRRQFDQNFLKDFLSLLMARSGFGSGDYYKDDALLMNVSEKDLDNQLMGMRSLLKFEPHIDVHHRSFLDFLQDASRSGDYHISKEAATRRYLDLIVKSLVQRGKSMIRRQGHKDKIPFKPEPEFLWLFMGYPTKIDLPLKEWREALQPVLRFWNELLRLPDLGIVTGSMRYLVLHLAFLTGVSDTARNYALMEEHHAVHAEGSEAMDSTVMSLNGCLSSLLTRLRRRKFGSLLDADMKQLASILLRFDSVYIVMNLRSISDAQLLMNLVDELINNTFSNDYDSDSSRRAAQLGLDIFARVPVLPQSLFLKGTVGPEHFGWRPHEMSILDLVNIMFMSKILDSNYVVRVLWIQARDNRVFLMGDRVDGDKSLAQWLETPKSDTISIMRIMLEVAKAIRYLHSMSLSFGGRMIRPNAIMLDSESHARFLFSYSVPRYVNMKPTLFFPSDCRKDIASFGHLFQELGHKIRYHFRLNVRDVEQRLMERCRLPDLDDGLTIEDVIREMEAWNL